MIPLLRKLALLTATAVLALSSAQAALAGSSGDRLLIVAKTGFSDGNRVGFSDGN